MTVRHQRGSYEVRFVETKDALKGLPSGSRLVTDTNLLDIYSDSVPDSLPVLAVAPGEPSKSFQTTERLVDWLAESGADRGTTVIAWGGGVIGDLAGFVAAVYMRGIALIQVPTTLLAMVDSSVGGKVGIDTMRGKNLVGAFWPPREVRVASGFLATLSERDWAGGTAEVVKYGVILDEGLFARFESHSWSEIRDWSAIVARCIELKSQVTEADEFETNGVRAILNCGHTVGHAIEAVTGYVGPAHGEAVAMGMSVEAELAERLGICRQGTATRIAGCLARQGLPTRVPPSLDPDELVRIMARDKKAAGGRLAFSLPTRIGECKLVTDVPKEDVLAVLKNK
jgi:3-dehydroquinate synthase